MNRQEKGQEKRKDRCAFSSPAGRGRSQPWHRGLLPLLVTAAGAGAAGPARAQDAGSVSEAGTAPAPGLSEVLYLNFSEGKESLTLATTDDAVANMSSIGMASPFPAFLWPPIATGATTRPEVIRRVVRQVHQFFLPYNVLVTTVRPERGPYTMVMIGGSAQDVGVQQRLGGVAYLDCEDKQHTNLVFAFPEALRGNEPALAVTIAQEAAHAFGLEHTANRRDVMYPEIDPMQMGFLDEESPIMDIRLCGNVTQNSHRKLLQTVGAWPGDTKPLDDGTRVDRLPPRLTLQAPVEGGPLPQPVTVLAQAEDEAGIDRLVLTAAAPGAVASERAIRHRPPWAWSLAGYPAGPLMVTLTAYDATGNTTVVSREILLGAPPRPPPGCALSAGGSRQGEPGSWLALLATALLLVRGGRQRHPPCTDRARPL